MLFGHCLDQSSKLLVLVEKVLILINKLIQIDMVVVLEQKFANRFSCSQLYHKEAYNPFPRYQVDFRIVHKLFLKDEICQLETNICEKKR